MSKLPPERRGTIAALGVAITIGVLLVVLQPGPRTPRVITEETSGPATSTSSTLAPAVQLCNLAKQFVRDAEGLDPYDVSRIAEVFYSEAAKLVEGAGRAEFEATARYYAEFNDIGVAYDYDVFRIAAAGKGDRWAQLIYRPPLGIETARGAVQFACRVELPSPPTLTTITPEPEPEITGPPRPASGATGSGATGATGTAAGPGAPAASGAAGGTPTSATEPAR